MAWFFRSLKTIIYTTINEGVIVMLLDIPIYILVNFFIDIPINILRDIIVG